MIKDHVSAIDCPGTGQFGTVTMKPIDFEKLFFRINVLVTLIVFTLLTPATQIVAKWYPDDEETLWAIAFLALIVSGLAWFATSLCLPFLFKWGIFEDRRSAERSNPSSKIAKLVRTVTPILNLMIHLVLLLMICFFIISLMESNVFDKLFQNLAKW